MRRWLSVVIFSVCGCNGGGEGPANGDAGGGGGAGGVPGAGGGSSTTPRMGPAPGQKRVFVTSSLYSGNLKVEGQAATGLEGADNLCRTAAAAANLGGTWKAWLSAGVPAATVTMSTNAVDRIAEVGPWYRLDGSKAFNNKANLMTAPLVPLDRDENGRPIPGSSSLQVWTGTSAGGRWSGTDCDQWTSGFANRSGTAGLATSADQMWTDGAHGNCGSGLRLYCFEQ